MAKNFGFDPFILLTMDTPEPTTVIGGGTGQSTTDPYACDFNDWMSLFASDLNNDGKTDFDDYRIWFATLEDAEDLWELFYSGYSMEPGQPFPENP